MAWHRRSSSNSTLPLYSASSSPPPPPYDAQSPYCRIGRQPVPNPLVSLDELKAHLCFLRAIKNLRTEVEGGSDRRYSEFIQSLGPAPRWCWIVQLAVERFSKWIQTVSVSTPTTWVQEQMPPLDVLMVWHTYMLNPQWYAEDCQRLPILAKLKEVNGLFIQSLILVGDIDQWQATESRKQAWRETCDCAFDPIEAATEDSLETHDIACPKCFAIQRIPLMNAERTGYIQQFSISCSLCFFRIQRDSLAAHKLVKDLVLDPCDAQAVLKHGDGVYLAGSLRNQTSQPDRTAASNIKQRIWDLPVCRNAWSSAIDSTLNKDESLMQIWQRSLLRELCWSMVEVRTKMGNAFKSSQPKVNRILSAYVDDRPYSVELVGAVLRQGSFIDKMHEHGWTSPGRFDSQADEVVLAHAIARYHAFLDLMWTSPGELFVPTLDIDLAWHTHQLKPREYADSCIQYVGRYIDHDDKVEESKLASSFDITCQAWQRQFGVPYTHCGCPMPIPENKLQGRLARVLSRRRRSTQPPTLSLVPPDHDDAHSASHASEHNAVISGTGRGFSSHDRMLRLRKIRDWKEKEATKARKKGVSPRRYDPDHNPAFLSAPPFYAYTGAPTSVCAPVESTCGGNHGANGSGCASSTSNCAPSSSNGGSACSSSTDSAGSSSNCGSSSAGSSSNCGGSSSSGCGSSGCGSSGCGSSGCGGGS